MHEFLGWDVWIEKRRCSICRYGGMCIRGVVGCSYGKRRNCVMGIPYDVSIINQNYKSISGCCAFITSFQIFLSSVVALHQTT